ncbi:MAG: hypothetical protein QF391_05995, partial [Myxococcota bacterium]|nr:hypothetical protein [Myxococcota bacterium]
MRARDLLDDGPSRKVSSTTAEGIFPSVGVRPPTDPFQTEHLRLVKMAKRRLILMTSTPLPRIQLGIWKPAHFFYLPVDLIFVRPLGENRDASGVGGFPRSRVAP